MTKLSPSAFSVARLYKATGYALEGLCAAWKSEAAFRLEILSCAVLVPVALILEKTALEKTVLLFSLAFVLITELANSAIEAVIDRISTEIHPLSKKAKDIGSAMVLLSLGNAAACWGLIIL